MKRAKIGPKPINLTLFDTSKCSKNQLLMCVIPEDARIWLDITSAKKIKILSGPYYVRGCGSFYEVLILKRKYYIHEMHLWDKE